MGLIKLPDEGGDAGVVFESALLAILTPEIVCLTKAILLVVAVEVLVSKFMSVVLAMPEEVALRMGSGDTDVIGTPVSSIKLSSPGS